MRLFFRSMTTALLTAALIAPAITGCAHRVYDPYYHDYHGWAGEQGHYEQWEHDTHRDHQDFNKRSSDDQKQYWDWRHNQDHH